MPAAQGSASFKRRSEIASLGTTASHHGASGRVRNISLGGNHHSPCGGRRRGAGVSAGSWAGDAEEEMLEGSAEGEPVCTASRGGWSVLSHSPSPAWAGRVRSGCFPQGNRLLSTALCLG